MESTDYEVVELTCGCGRPVPPGKLQEAAAVAKAWLTCSECGARASLITLLRLRTGRKICGRCGAVRCLDGCCCGC